MKKGLSVGMRGFEKRWKIKQGGAYFLGKTFEFSAIRNIRGENKGYGILTRGLGVCSPPLFNFN